MKTRVFTQVLFVKAIPSCGLVEIFIDIHELQASMASLILNFGYINFILVVCFVNVIEFDRVGGYGYNTRVSYLSM
jgi:hypothetical protein